MVPTRRPLPGSTGNPYLEALHQHRNDPARCGDELLTQFGFAVPNEAALEGIAQHSPQGVVEIGAGTGYWARLLADQGIDVAAFDIAPPPSSANKWFAGVEPWFPVAWGDERVVIDYPERTVLLVWPTRDEDWGADAALLHAAGGGQKLIYVGEPPGGRTGDLRLHAVLGLVDRCLACTYGVTTVPCTCGVDPVWRAIEERPLPNRPGAEDRLYVFGPAGLPARERRLRLPSSRWIRKQRRA